MRGFVAPLFFAASVVAAALPPEAAGTPIFVMDTDEATYTLIHRVNPQTGQLTTLGEMPPDDVMAALAAASDDLLYAVSYAGNLYRITVSPFGGSRWPCVFGTLMMNLRAPPVRICTRR